MLRAARTRTGLTDFGDDRFLEPLGVLVDSLETEANLSAFGRLLTQRLLVQLLSTRLLVEDALARRPEIVEIPVEAPIVIVGLPRSGTTHLHNLIAEDRSLRSLPYWESLEPMLLPAEREKVAAGAADPRIERCARAVRFLDHAMPLLSAMHEMTPDHVHEEIQLLAADFSTMLFESSYLVPSYREWYKRTDQTAAYGYLRLMLQVLQAERGGPRRWLLKSPQHLEQIPALMATFPDARVVRTHRDPVRVTASIMTLVAYGLRMNHGAIDPLEIGRVWSARAEDLLRGVVQDADRVPSGQAFDVKFPELMRDNMAMVDRIYAFAGGGETGVPAAAARAAMQTYLDTHPPGRHGSIEYRLEDFGVDPLERRQALRFYQERFQIDDE